LFFTEGLGSAERETAKRGPTDIGQEISSMPEVKLHPVILSGGAGTRLWPLSRALYPKQLLPLASDRTLIQETAARVSDAALFAPPVIVCNAEHRFIVAEQLAATDIRPQAIILEAQGRNTAPAAAIAALRIAEHDGDAVMLVMPSDHVIADAPAFLDAVSGAARTAASAGHLVTFGICPDGPETGYGYIRRGKAFEQVEGCHAVAEFTEKPDAQTAAGYLSSGDYFWNSGIFLFPVALYLEELERFAPDVLAACRRAVAGAHADLAFERLDDEAFLTSPSISIDYAVMERTKRAAVVPVDIGWSDVGSWTALWRISDKDEAGTAISGDVLTLDVTNSLLRSDGPAIAALGLDDTIIVATKDVVLAAAKDRAQDVKRLVERIARSGREEHRTHLTVYRPWGSFETIDEGPRFKVKRIVVNPGAKLSLQKHHHRAEHWVVVRGTARITRGEETLLLEENQSTYIPLGTAHRLENPGKIPLHIIEVQSGSYLGEDDIVRLEDTYGRG